MKRNETIHVWIEVLRHQAPEILANLKALTALENVAHPGTTLPDMVLHACRDYVEKHKINLGV